MPRPMPIMVRLEKFKNLQNKACLPSIYINLGRLSSERINTVTLSTVYVYHQISPEINNICDHSSRPFLLQLACIPRRVSQGARAGSISLHEMQCSDGSDGSV